MLHAELAVICCRFRDRRLYPTGSFVQWTRRLSIIAFEFARLGRRALKRIKTVFKTNRSVIIYTGTGTGAWEAALVNTLSPGDHVLMAETGQFALLWKKMAEKLDSFPSLQGDWRLAADPRAIEAPPRRRLLRSTAFRTDPAAFRQLWTS
jgi:hypothetical protein